MRSPETIPDQLRRISDLIGEAASMCQDVRDQLEPGGITWTRYHQLQTAKTRLEAVARLIQTIGGSP